MQQQQQQQQKQPLPPSEMLSFGGSGSRMPDGGGGIISNEQAEAVSPISSRPPAPSSINFDDLVLAEHQLQHDHLNLGGGGGSSSGNRWPRQETLTLLKIRSEMDVAFRDATLKGPLWDEVSRKLGELGYVRSAKKCKEKFENVHKYYKRTKESRAGRQDGKTYRFFNQLEAMQPPPPPPQPPPTATDQSGSTAPHLLLLPPAPQQHVTILAASGPPTSTPVSLGMTSSTSRVLQPFTMHYSTTSGFVSSTQLPVFGTVQSNTGISFSSDTVFSDSDDDDMMSDDEDQEEREEFDDRPASSNPKRKRSSSGSGSWKGGGKRGRMMDFFEGLMKQVMQKQETMQQKFLETIEKREQDRLKREEAWKQHEAFRIGREQQLAAQERAMAASRDAAIVSFLHKITGQTIQLPPQPQPQPQPQPIVYTTTTATTAVHRVAPAPTKTHVTEVVPLQPIQPQKNSELVIRQQQTISQMPPPPPIVSSEIIMAVPERQIPPSSQTGQELTSSSAGETAAAGTASPSRWPKAEVLALIKLRSNLENRYQEAGPKGPLWEEISSGMQRIGYNRSSKRCKEKWENINKYFKKVKESNKKRPEDAKTCPYFNELDALYQRKKLTGAGGSSSSSSMMVQFQQQQQQESSTAPTTAFNDPLRSSSSIVPGSGSSSVVQHQASVGLTVHIETDTSERGSDGNNDQQQTNNTGGSIKPEDIMMEQQKQLDLEDDDVCECDDISAAEEEDDENDSKKESKIRYNNIDQFKRPRNNENGGTPSSSSSSSFNITMVQ